MSTIPKQPRPFFPSSRAGVLAGVALVAAVLVASVLESAGVPIVSPTAAFVALAAAFATIPRAIQPRGNGILAPIGQVASGAVYGSALVIGLAGSTASMMTGSPVWASVALVVCILGLAVGLAWAFNSRHTIRHSPAA
ncbi:hypothetical protein [Compostimonas suwonensis]|uniref:Uncharacterized protein n=1 Tax=Compostimonas suwonensis TaxID=1048394 RepID=A0A2M9C3C8_9MICO|nr:hypothetical protein [Compostimonas suwonensis]PJJ65012.1 hypothetical protein CLV54_0037 [Compostimonas suwonensis]